MGLFDRFFQAEEGETHDAKAALEEAQFTLNFAQHPEYANLVDWLDHEAGRTIEVKSDAQTLIAEIARQNTMKQVKSYLKGRLAKASATIALAREENNG